MTVRASELALMTVPNMEILEVGEDWATSTGLFSWTAEDLVSAIQSQEDPAVRAPVVKLGHVDPRFDGQPAFGRVENLRLENNGQTLVADLVGVPAWLAKVVYSAYPRRSIEGQFDYRSRTGNEWSFVLTGLSLLGDAYPAINTLEDVQALWGEDPPPLYPVEDVEEIAATEGFFRARRVDDMPKWLQRTAKAGSNEGKEVRAALSLDEIRRAYYDSLGPTQMWWWIREMRVNPLELIVDDDEGGLYRVPVSVSGDDTVTFEDPVLVKVEYIEAAGPEQLVAATYQAPTDTGRKAKEGTEDETDATHEEVDVKLTDDALRRLGLEPGATEEDINAAILAQVQEASTEETPPVAEEETPPVTGEETPPGDAGEEEPPAQTTTEIPDGMTLIDEATLTELREGAVAARSLQEKETTRERDTYLDNAVKAGKFPRSRRDHYVKLYAADPEGTRSLIDSLAKGVVPVEETGTAGGESDPAVQAAYPDSWKPSVNAARRGIGSRVKVVGD